MTWLYGIRPELYVAVLAAFILLLASLFVISVALNALQDWWEARSDRPSAPGPKSTRKRIS